MSILGTDPPDWENANVVLIDSDASSNREAVLEIEKWAARHGFARTNEHWLRPVMRKGGQRALRGTCYRLTQEEKAGGEALVRDIEETTGKLEPAIRDS